MIKKDELQEKKNLQANYGSPIIRKRDEPMKMQNRENKEKDSDTHSQETEEATGREKVGEGAIRKRRTQEEIATNPKKKEGKVTKEKEEQRNMTEDRNKKKQEIPSVYYRRRTRSQYWKKNYSQLSK